jgi:threonine synthase
MQYYSTNGQSPKVDFKEATINGLAPDKGLYFPETIPELSSELITNIHDYSDAELAFQAIQPYAGASIPSDVLRQVVEETINFPIPLVKVNDRISSLELFHGPTLAFKDIGARFMSRCLSYFVQADKRKVTVLVATSGDTGGAVASGFFDVPNVDVVILYPSGKVSSVQEKQLTTLGKNIHALEVDGTFDDCQRMVKQAFADEGLTRQIFLTSANSINVARWLPQQFYYFFACKQWNDTDAPVVAVPSGNFGNICAGVLAQRAGLPVKHFIAACNANDIVPEYFHTGEYHPKPSVSTISNAMDVGDPSNFVRLLEMFNHDINALRSVVSSVSVSDEITRHTLKEVYEKDHYLLDPHGAVGYYALEQWLAEHPGDKGMIIETAHPVKFYDVVEPVIGSEVPIPPAVQAQLGLQKKSHKIEADYNSLKQFLVDGNL